MTEPVYVQYGAGWSSGEGWRNFDSSPRLWMERLPIFGPLFSQGGAGYPADVEFGNILTGLPLPDGSVRGIYASHVLEHLSYVDFQIALRNTFRLLEPGGVFRLIVPDLEERARRYIDRARDCDPLAAESFMEECCLGAFERPKSLIEHFKASLGNTGHLWMWDRFSMQAALEKVGFVEVRFCQFGDAPDSAFRAVEAPDRFVDEKLGITEVAVECQRPTQSENVTPRNSFGNS